MRLRTAAKRAVFGQGQVARMRHRRGEQAAAGRARKHRSPMTGPSRGALGLAARPAARHPLARRAGSKLLEVENVIAMARSRHPSESKWSQVESIMPASIATAPREHARTSA